MSFDVKKNIKKHAIVSAIYSVIAVVTLFWTINVPNYAGVVVMIAYAGILIAHALFIIMHFAFYSNLKETWLKALLLLLAIGIIGFGLCMSPVLFY